MSNFSAQQPLHLSRVFLQYVDNKNIVSKILYTLQRTNLFSSEFLKKSIFFHCAGSPDIYKSI